MVVPADRARLGYAAIARELADHATSLVAHVGDHAGTPERRIREGARAARRLSAGLLRMQVLAELLDGATWAEVAAALGLSEATVRADYETAVAVWSGKADPDTAPDWDFSIGLLGDPDPAGTAEALDSWLARRRDPWDAEPGGPVSAMLAGDRQD